MRRLKGFTLIELLVVVAIIGILATVIVVNLTSSQNKARDAKIQTDLEQIASAAELIKVDATGGQFNKLVTTNARFLAVGTTAIVVDKSRANNNVNYNGTLKSVDTTYFVDVAGTALLGTTALDQPSTAGGANNNYWWKTDGTPVDATHSGADTGKYAIYAMSIVNSTSGAGNQKYFYCTSGKTCNFTALPTSAPSAN